MKFEKMLTTALLLASCAFLSSVTSAAPSTEMAAAARDTGTGQRSTGTSSRGNQTGTSSQTGTGTQDGARGKQEAYGKAAYGKESFDALKVDGMLALDGTTIEGLLEVNGMLMAEWANIGELRVNGMAKFRDSTIRGKTAVSGMLKAKRTKFQGMVTIASQMLLLASSEADSITVRKIPGRAVQTLILLDGTTVDGDVIFESGRGEVVMDASSKILGNVRGAQTRAPRNGESDQGD